jgi:fatty acid desaturase
LFPESEEGNQADAFGSELDELRATVVADLGQRDADHIRRVGQVVAASEVFGRLLLHVGIDPVTFVLGAGALGVSKILENLEIGHNVMHGQYDWMRDETLNSRDYEPDSVCAGDDWRRTHNFEHHIFTNILGKDRDLGYSFFRVCPEQPWRPRHLFQLPVAAGLAFLFQWGIALHACRADEIVRGERPIRDVARLGRKFLPKAGWQTFKDYCLYPALALGNAPRVVAGNLVANTLRNVWLFSIVFCGHFPEEVKVFRREATLPETRGEFYARQVSGSANFEGSRWMHLLSGHVSYQIEHHLFPDIPASRYPEIAPRVREICARYGQPYVSGRMVKQLSNVGRRLLRLSLPGAQAERTARA